MALHLEAKAITNQDADATTTAATDDSSGKNATPANHDDDEKPKTAAAAAAAAAVVDIDDDELFELDIALLDGRGDDGHGSHRRHRSHSAAVAVADDGAGHALLANCLLPVQSVSSAVPVPASSVLSLYHPYSGYYSSRRLIFTGGSGDSRRFLGRSAGRFCFSSRGFETMGSSFQRY